MLALPVGTVFVFDLYHDDGAAVGDGQVLHFVGYGFFEDGYALQKVSIGLAQADVFLFKQPPGQSAHFPFGTNVGTGTQDDVHVVLLA